jgi:hypothetical protein
MNMIEERIRAAARAAADTVAPDSVPPLELPAARSRRLGRRRRPRRPAGAASPAWNPWAARLAPVAAALAVTAIVITVVEVSPAPHQGGPAFSPSTAAQPDVPLGPPVSAYVRSGQVPPYFVTLAPSGAAVHLTVSGATLATIRPAPPGGRVVAVTSAGDDRTFVLAEQGRDHKAVAFYKFQLGSSGRPGALARLPMSVAAGKTMTGLALSPDGSRLAVAVASRAGVQQIRLYPVLGIVARTWSATGGTIGTPYAAGSLSWPASQRTLAFNWSAGQKASVRLLDTGSDGGSLLAASHPAVTLANAFAMGKTLYQCQEEMIITPDGSTIVCPSTTIAYITKNRPTKRNTGFPEFSATTGRPIRILGDWAQDQTEPSVSALLWAGTAGKVLIGMVHSAGRDWVGVISGNKFTPLGPQQSLNTYAFGTW